MAFLPPRREADLFEEKLELVVCAGERVVATEVAGAAAVEETPLVVPLL